MDIDDVSWLAIEEGACTAVFRRRSACSAWGFLYEEPLCSMFVNQVQSDGGTDRRATDGPTRPTLAYVHVRS